MKNCEANNAFQVYDLRPNTWSFENLAIAGANKKHLDVDANASYNF